MSVTRQLSLFGADATAPEAVDLVGLLLAGGTVSTAASTVSNPGGTVSNPGGAVGTAGGIGAEPPDGESSTGAARVEVGVGHPWRAAALVAECARRGLAATSVATPTTSISVRTAYAPALAPVAARWLVEGGLRIPSDLRLDGRVLRLWAQAVGYVGAGGYVLPVRAGSEEEVQAVGAALAALGLGGQLAVSRGSHQCSYRFVGKRRLARLTELIGDPPKHAPALVWPS